MLGDLPLDSLRWFFPFPCDSGDQFLWLVCFRFSHQPVFYKSEGILRQQLKRLENCTHWDDGRLTMKSKLFAIVAAVVLVGCGEAIKSTSLDLEEPLNKNPKTQPSYQAQLNKDTDLNAMDPMGMNPLHSAVWESNLTFVKLLINKGADVNLKNIHGWTPLMRAANNGSKGIAEVLIANGAEVNAIGIGGMTPLDHTVIDDHKETASLLRKHGGKTGEELKAEGK